MNISVIIPLYNAEKYIAKALDSCLALPEVKEIIVVDDAYKDNAIQIVKEYQLKFPFIQLYQHPNHQNLGAGASRNLGIAKATQDYIAFLDADDFYLPNRFTKDKEIFAQYPDADGCYNAIGTHFYSEKAKEQYNQTFSDEITTVYASAQPNPENLLKGLVGMISDYGYYTLDGLTLKRNSLLASKVTFSDLRIHQDTVFCVKLAHHLRLYPSNLQMAVAMRGVHEENRITANNNADVRTKSYKRYLMWDHLYQWTITQTLESSVQLHIRNRKEYYFYISQPEYRPLFFFKEVLQHPHLLQHPQYTDLHKKYLGNLRSSAFLYKMRNWLVHNKKR